MDSSDECAAGSAMKPSAGEESHGIIVAVGRGEASHRPHIGMVFVDWAADRLKWVLTHVRTSEQVELPYSGELKPTLIFDEEGFGCVLPGSDMAEPELVDDLLSEKLFTNPDGTHSIVARTDSGIVTHASLEALESLWRSVTVSTLLGPLRGEVKFDSALFVRRRVGCNLWWNMLSVYSSAGFTFKVNFPSTWLHKGLPSWNDLATWAQAEGHIMQSKAYDDAAKGDRERVLPFVSMSSVAFVLLASAWSFGSKRRCGMQQEDNRDRARIVYDFLMQVAGNGVWDLHLFATGHVKVDAARPMAGTSLVTVLVRDGCFDIAELVDKCQSHMSAEAHDFADLVKASVDAAQGVTHIGALLAGAWRSSSSDLGKSLVTQLIHILGSRMDGIICASADGISDECGLPGLPDGTSIVLEGHDFSSDYKLDRALYKYVRATNETFTGLRFHSVAADKSRVGVQAVMCGAMVASTNLAAWLVPQVVADFTSEVDTALIVAGEGAAQEEVNKRRRRQQAWVDREEAEDCSNWQVQKRPRQASYHFLRYLDHQVIMATTLGLEQYQQDPDPAKRGHPSTWPRLCLALDQESSGICASGFAQRCLHMNLEQWWDFSHSCWRDIICALKSTDNWGHTLLALISYNVPFGPWADDMRFQQVKESMTHLFQTEQPQSCPIFLDLMEALIKEGNNFNILGSDQPELTLWRRCEQYSPWNLRGDKVVMNKFMGMRRRAESETAVWAMRSLAYQVCALECGFLKGSGFAKVVIPEKATNAAEPGGRTSTKRMQGYEKALKSSCANSLAVATVFYADWDNFVRQRIFCVATGVLDSWYTRQSKETRCVEDTGAFLTEQAGGGFVKMIAELLGTCHSLKSLGDIGFTLPAKPMTNKPEDDDPDLIQQDAWADDLGRLVVSLAGHRLKRMTYFIRSWPHRSAAMLLPGAAGQRVVDELREDYNAFKYCKEHEHLPKVQELTSRSVFNCVSAQQLVGMCECNGWRLTGEMLEWLRSATAKNVSSIICEDGFNRMKGKIDKQNSHRGREQRAFGQLIEQRVLGQVHKYLEIDSNGQPECRTAKLPSSAFRPSMMDTSVKGMRKIIGTSGYAKPHWYSPGVDALPTEHLDLSMMRYLQKTEQIGLWSSAWLSIFVSGQHKLLVRYNTNGPGGRPQNKWHFALQEVSGTCSLVWPAREVKVKNMIMYVFSEVPPGDVSELHFPVVDLDTVDAIPYEWRSPLYVARRLGVHPHRMPFNGCAAFPTVEKDKILRIACKHAFWKLPLSTMVMLASHLGIRTPKKDLYSVLAAVVQHVLGTSAQQTVDFLSARLGNDASAGYMTELLEMDEAYQVIDKDDREECKKERDRQRSAAAEAASF